MGESQINTRELALEMLLETETRGTFSHVVRSGMLSKYQFLSKQDRSFVTRLTEGTLEYQLRLDYVIDQYSKTPVRKCRPLIRVLLRLSVYQLLFMDGVPDRAVCNEAVKLAAKRGFGTLKGFVNGVLRTIARQKEEIVWPDPQDTGAYFSIWYSCPRWLVDQWLEAYGRKRTEQILEASLQPSPTIVWANTQEVSREEIWNSLEGQGVRIRIHPYLEEAWVLTEYDYLGGLEAFREGWIVVQDISSMITARIAAPEKGQFLLDVCAAPGGKSLHLAGLMEGTGIVEARDLSEEKIELIEDNVRRTGLTNIRTKVWDGTRWDPSLENQADVVLADVPCSGLGVMGRKPDIKYHMTPEKELELTTLQKQIITNSVQYVKQGGTFVYSTCTINRGENEDTVSWILDQFDLEPVDLRSRLPQALQKPDPDGAMELCQTMEKGYFQFLPGIHESDGFFVAGFRRKQE